jgi:hypothetical protein
MDAAILADLKKLQGLMHGTVQPSEIMAMHDACIEAIKRDDAPLTPSPSPLIEGSSNVDSAESKREALAAIGRALWRELFTTIETAEQLADWESRIPRFDCDCYRFYERWKSTNSPSFPLSFHWKYTLKSAVNEKLGVPNISEAEAITCWGNMLPVESHQREAVELHR